MILFYDPHLLLAILLTFFAVSPCWATPIEPPSTPPQRPGGQGPATPGGAPAKGGARTTFKITEYLQEWLHEQPEADGFPYSKGGVESTVQYLFEYHFKKYMGLSVQSQLKFREELVYQAKKQAADWVLHPDIMAKTVHTKGLIVELKVESSSATKKTRICGIRYRRSCHSLGS